MPDNTLGEIGHNGIGLSTQERHPATWPDGKLCIRPAVGDPLIELVAIIRRSTENDSNKATRPHRVTLHMDGLDLIRFVQLAMDQKTTPITKE